MFDSEQVTQLLSEADQERAKSLFQSFFFSKASDPSTRSWLRAGCYGGLIECVRALDGIPYFVIGDSHVQHYVRQASLETQWLAPLPLIFLGAPAKGLSDESSHSNPGPEILRWAQIIADLSSNPSAIIFLKFGGIDSELLWHWHRLNNGVHQHSVAAFDIFACESVTEYGRFLQKLANILERKQLRVCSVFPAVIADTQWRSVFAALFRLDDNHPLAESFQKLEVPTLFERTRLRGVYNKRLRDMCEKEGLWFVDDYAPFLDAGGNTDSRYLAASGDHHLAHGASEESLVKLIWTSVGSPPALGPSSTFARSTASIFSLLPTVDRAVAT